MDRTTIIKALEAEIARLEEAKSLLTGGGISSVKRGATATKVVAATALENKTSLKRPKRRRISAEGRARIAAAQKKRWANARKESK